MNETSLCGKQAIVGGAADTIGLAIIESLANAGILDVDSVTEVDLETCHQTITKNLNAVPARRAGKLERGGSGKCDV